MPAKSERQRKLACAALRHKKTGKPTFRKAREMAKSMSEKDLEEFCRKLGRNK